MGRKPLILNIDDSVHALPSANKIDLTSWHQAIRFGCTMATFNRFELDILHRLPDQYGTIFTGSGDFHHLSLAFIKAAARKQSQAMRVVVFDNHPDNMRFPFGVHCGSWVRAVCALPNVVSVEVIGICSKDVSAMSLWENYLSPLWRGKLRYWCFDIEQRWIRRLGLAKAYVNCHDVEDMLDKLEQSFKSITSPIYLSIDKDVLCEAEIRSNWDQGRLTLKQLTEMIALLPNRVIASDITGEVSEIDYQSPWKRWLSARDRQAKVAQDDISLWRIQHQRVNLKLLNLIATKSS